MSVPPHPLDGIRWDDHAHLTFATLLAEASRAGGEDGPCLEFDWEHSALSARLPSPFESRRWGDDLLKCLPVPAWEHLQARSKVATQAALRALFGHLVFEYRNLHGIRVLRPQEVVRAHIDSVAEMRGTQFECLHVATALGHAAELAIQVNADELLREALNLLLAESEAGLAAGDPGRIIHMLKHLPAVLERKRTFSPEFRPTAERFLDEVSRLREAGHWPEQAFDYLIKLAEDPESRRAARLRRAIHILTVAQSADVPGDRLRALHFYDEAIAEFSALGERQLAASASEASRRCAAAHQPEMKTTTTEVQIDTSGVTKFIDALASLDSWEARLSTCARLPDMIPNQKTIAHSAREVLQSSPFFALVRQVVVVDGRTQEPPAEERFDLECRRMARLNIDLGCHVVWMRVLAALREQGLTSDVLVTALRESDLLPGADWDIVQHGLERVFASDHVSGIHVLIPQLERVVRERARLAGVSATIFSDAHGRRLTERTLGSLLNDEDISNAFDADLCSFLTLVLVDEVAGFNLRNKIAHGLMSARELTASVASLVIFCYVALLRPPVATPEEASTTDG